ncbi:uncharacterized protein MONOS_15808 [Monocercomonoides exilis]|uniref:uncharacterized protein n=1 Tax=Monocercomonoides exilis TaxID=2049356 RepID=UPI00355AC63E|nr:hypothetical protein MONOS_15808 [Monocercomonoides exilis]|eukprot:MONOS_15808.1-p1 / transcript=MONOS_15808.1 / gene=MONOS_15808 / organism=Monocercomonoides_exilis_PA203 / gene_product=unspecified product / transcript_product=unspecified product / location=Mono_scaffold01361:7143-7498(+) / protein_length=97 / sequence_SO=supercontig / SO=protein_coding / is_pseudo=false
MYFVCESLVVSVKEPLVTFMGNITQKDNSIVGHDRTEAFGDWNVDFNELLAIKDALQEHTQCDVSSEEGAIECRVDKDKEDKGAEGEEEDAVEATE